MIRKNLIKSGILVSAVLLASVSMFSGRAWKKGTQSGNLQELVPSVQPGSVQTLSLSWGSYKTNLVNQQGCWMVAERNIPADIRLIVRLTDRVSKLRPVKRILPVDDELLEKLHLKPDGKNPGMRITLKDSKGKALYDLMLGKFFFMDSETPGGQRSPDGRYMAKIMPDGKMIPFLTAGILDEFLPVPGAWIRLPPFEHPENTLQVRYYSHVPGTPSWFLARPDITRNFALLLPPGKRHISVEKIRELFTLLSRHYAGDILPKQDFSARKSIGILELTDKSGVVRKMFLFRLGRTICCTLSADVRQLHGKKDPEADAAAQRFNALCGKVYAVGDKALEILTRVPEETTQK